MPNSHTQYLKKYPRLNRQTVTPVTLFQIYRFFLSVFLLALFFTRTGPSWLGGYYPALFKVVAIAYLGFTITSLIISQQKKISLRANTHFTILTDIVFITLLMHASGGIQSGLGLLMAISITASGLMMKGRMAIFFASLATVALIFQQFATFFYDYNFPTDFLQSALLGIAFFAIALLSHTLSKHIEESEQLAQQSQYNLRNMAQLSEDIIHHMQQGVIATDTQGNVRLINNAAKAIFSENTPSSDFNLEKLCPALFQKISQLYLSNKLNKTYVFTVTLAQTSNSSSDLKVTIKPLGIHKDEGALVFLEDLTELTQRAQQLKLASIGRLTASIAHEIRNPLGAISHASQLLGESDNLQNTDSRLIEIISDNALRMNQTIENVLKLSKRDNTSPCEVLLQDWTNKLKSQILQVLDIDQHQFAVKTVCKNPTGYFDPNQINQVMTIFAENAVHHFHKDKSQIKLNISIICGTEKLMIEFEDNGPGISKETADKIFEPFFTTNSSGTGLGLYIARELAESNNGQITYAKGFSGGSKFTVFLPNKPSET